MFSGAFTALVTPFRNGEVDVEALEGLVEFQIQHGIHGLVPCGTTGETPAMSEEEDRLVIGTVVRVAGGRVPVVAGTGSNSTDMAIKYTRMAQEEGAETMARLAEIPNIVGVKESTLSMNMVSDVKRLCGEEFALLSGDDPMTVPLMALGGQGVISVASNVAPAAVSDMVNALSDGDWERGRELHYQLLPLFRALFVETNPIPVKTAASILGLCSDEMRLPMTPLQGDNLDLLRRTMEESNHLLPTPEEV
jgi:4-hydroxy-tetrahydrodipicolinate synthase